MTYWTTFFLVVLAVAAADVCWTLYFIEVEKRHSIRAGIWSAAIMLVSAFTVTNYINERSFIIAAVIGAFVGTAGILTWKNKQEQK